ncbi:transmembrane protein 132C, partial [Megalops cyprinoides]|uniref:transmembrane protein 132C n=1 Tax=Megalops cyprinoides TaxID=118141 RepID=UPI0018646406
LLTSAELESQEVSDNTKSPSPFPMSLPASYQVLDADYLFLKEASQDIMQNSSMQTYSQSLVILQASRPPTVNASYGPLSVERVVPLDLVQTVQLFRSTRDFTFNWKVQSFVLTRRVFSSSPKVRVLFYVAGRDWDSGDAGLTDELPCVTVYAFWQTQEVRASCYIQGQRGTCMAELEPMTSWFSPSGESSSRERQEPAEGNTMELYYQACPGPCGKPATEDDKRRGGAERPQADDTPVTPMQRIGSVRLLQVPQGAASVSQLKLGDAIIIQTSSKPLKRTDIATFYVFMSSSSSLDRFTLKATVKKGVSFCTATPSNSLLWDTTLDTGADGTISILCQRKSAIPGKRLESSLLEILQLDFEAEELSSQSESQVITWRLELPGNNKAGDEGTMRIYTTQRDFVGLAPLVMDTEILNTAVLTGKRVTVPVRTVAVEQDGSVTDVSEFTDCRSTNEDILKVSDRCDYVYVNGKEMRGKVKMAVNFTYSYLSAQLEMTVWIPRLPLQIEVSDAELSQIKGWRVPIVASKRTSWDSEEEEDRKGKGCMLQFQHALVRVLTHFVADQLDQREQVAYFLGEDWQVDVTKLVRYFLKVEDPRIARLHAGRVLSGRDVGVTAIQVMSPLSDSILAEKTVSVLDDKVTITELGVQVVSGLSLSLQLSPGSNRAIVATATTQEVLQSPKQEAVVSTWIQFSDGSLTPLDIYDPSYYMLTVTSLDEGVVSVRKPPVAVVAEGEGQGALVKVEMVISEACQKSKRKSTLAVGSGSLKVRFQPSSHRPGGQSSSKPDSRSDYGNDGEELGSNRKELQPQQGLTSSSVSEREESAMRKVTTTAKSTVQDVGSVSGGSSELGMDAIGSVGSVSSVGSVRNVANIVNTGSAASPGGNGGIGNIGGPSSDGSINERGPGKDHSNLVDYTNFPSQVEVPKQKEVEVEVEMGNDLKQGSRPLTDLEIGMYALLGVFCLAILVFLVNCISYVVKFRHKQPPTQGQEPAGHRHDWVWLGTDAELVMNVPGTPPQQDSHNTTIIDIGPATEKTATLGRNTSYPPQADPQVSCMGSLQTKPARRESIHSPTSKRKRVQFTTFASLDSRNRSPDPPPRENGLDIQWVGKEENCEEPKVPTPDHVDHL